MACVFFDLHVAVQLTTEESMDELGMLFVASIGLICIYAGYQLFCDIPSGVGARALILNIVPGALLGLAGMGILTAEFRMAIFHKPVIERRQRTEERGRVAARAAQA